MQWKLYLRGVDDPVGELNARKDAAVSPHVGDIVFAGRTSDAKCYRVLARVFISGDQALVVEEAEAPIKLPQPRTADEVAADAKASKEIYDEIRNIRPFGQ